MNDAHIKFYGFCCDGWRSLVAEALMLVAIACLVHAVVLVLVYPGFYDPFWPSHSDLYIAASSAHSTNTITNYLFSARPISNVYFYLTGYFGIRGSIVANLFLVVLNCVLTAMILRRVAKIPFSFRYLIGFILFTFLVFSHPLQYVWSTYDLTSQLSYFFVACAVLVFLHHARIWVLFCLILCAFLAKETFILSTVFLFVVWWWLVRQADAKSKVIRTGLALGLALVVTAIQQKVAKSNFVGYGSDLIATYQVNLSPKSLATEWLLYANQGMSLASWAVVALVAVTCIMFRRKLGRVIVVLSICLPIAGMLAWLPNSALPNHHFPGYAFNGSYLLFAPVVFIGEIYSARWITRLIFAFVTLGIIVSPVTSRKLYEANRWTIDQQLTQKRLLTDIVKQLTSIPLPSDRQVNRTVLVTGLDIPFYPFHYGNSLLSLGDVKGLRFSVVTYDDKHGDMRRTCDTPAKGESPGLVQFVSPETAECGDFDYVWMFRHDGSLIRVISNRNDTIPVPTLGLSSADLMVFPAVAEILGVADGTVDNSAYLDDGYKLLSCGVAFISYQQYALALRCLVASAHKIPDNPYPWFYMGVAYEKLNRYSEAKTNYEKAIALANNPNPAFVDGLRRIEKHLANQH